MAHHPDTTMSTAWCIDMACLQVRVSVFAWVDMSDGIVSQWVRL